MTTFANFALGLALFVWLCLLYLITVASSDRSHGSAAEVVSATITLLPWIALMAIALGVATAKGGFTWLGGNRGLQFAIVLAAHVALGVVVWFSAGLRGEAASQMPWAVRPMIPWAVFVLPPLAMAFCAVMLNSASGQSMALRAAFATVGGVSLLACAGMLLQLGVSSANSQAASVQRSLDAQTDRDRQVLAEVESLNPEHDLAQLLNFTNKFEEPPIRDLALQKVRSLPHFSEELARQLRGEGCGEALTFLDGADAPDPGMLAEPVREAFLRVAARARERMRTESWLYDDSFDWDAGHVLAVADKFQGRGVDYGPAIREFRSALDEPRSQKIHLNCVRPLDQWLKSHPSR